MKPDTDTNIDRDQFARLGARMEAERKGLIKPFDAAAYDARPKIATMGFTPEERKALEKRPENKPRP